MLAGLSSDSTLAETELDRALAIAREQSAKLFELRAAMSLARLWAVQGKRVEARSLLAPVHDYFTEGFGTLDLQEARLLLDELANSAGRLRWHPNRPESSPIGQAISTISAAPR